MKNTFAFDFVRGEFILDGEGGIKTVSGIDALKVWIEKILRTQYDRYKLYNGTNYGSNIEDLTIGRTYSATFADSELKREIETALLKNEDILSITSISISRKGKTLTVDISMSTVYGIVEEVFAA